MTKLLRILSFLLLLHVNAQAQHTLNGTVTDSIGAPVPFAIVALLHAGDSALVAGTPTDERGNFVFTGMHRGIYFVKISATGYDVQFSSIVSFDSTESIVIPPIVLRATIRNAVTVKAAKATFEFRNGNTIVNVENSALAKGNSVFDLLPKLPGVSVDKGEISIRGKSGVIVMIDNRVQQVSGEQLVNLLRNMSAESVARIEILVNPPVKYDASGTSGMINIITKKNTQKGFFGNVYANTSQAFYNYSGGGLSLNYTNAHVSLFSGVDGFYGWHTSAERFFRKFGSDQGTMEMETDTYWREKQTGLSFRAGADWYASKNATLGCRIDGAPGGYTSYGSSGNYVSGYNTMGFDHASSGSYIPNRWNSTNYNVNGEWRFDTAGTALRFFADYTDVREKDHGYNDNSFYDVNGVTTLPPNNYRNSNRSLAAIYSARLDFTKAIDSTSTFEAGCKASSVRTSNDYLFERQNNSSGVFFTDSSLTSRYDYNEETLAAYADYSKSWKKLQLLLGVRAEETVLNGHNSHSDVVVQDRYFNLFPTVSFSYTAAENHELQLNLGRRIDRPAFDDLNPFIYYRDQYAFYQGNPALQPQYGNSAELSYSFKGAIVNSVSYERIDHVMLDHTFQNDTTKIFIETVRNMNFQQSFTYSLFIRKDIRSWWSLTFSGNLFFAAFKGDIRGVPFHTQTTSCFANLQNTFALPQHTNLELLVMYRGPKISGITQINSVWMVSLAVKKTFFNEKLSCTIGAEDLFHTMKFHTHARFDNQDWNFYMQYDSQRVNVSLSYNFGRVKAEERDSTSNEEEKERLGR